MTSTLDFSNPREPTSPDGRRLILPALLDDEQEPYWPGAGDDIANAVRGDGPAMKLSRLGGGTVSQDVQFIDFVHIIGGELRVNGADQDSYVDLSVVAPATATTPNGGGTGNCNLVPTTGGNVIVPAPGNGAHDVDHTSALNANLAAKATGRPTKVTAAVPVPAWVMGDDGVDVPQGYWNLDEETGDISPAFPVGGELSGYYHLLDFEATLVTRMSKYPLWGPGGELDRSMADLMARARPKQVLPHWLIRVVVTHAGLTTITVIWSLQMARSLRV